MFTFACVKMISAIAMSRRLILSMMTVLGLCLNIGAMPVDSLYVQFLNCNDREKIQIANDVFAELARVRSTDSLYHYDKQANRDIVEAQLHYQVANYYFEREQYHHSLDAIEHAYALSHKLKDMQLKGEVLAMMHKTHIKLGNYDLALHCLLEGYRIDQQLGDKKLVSRDLNSLAAIYLAVQQPQVGIPFIERAITIERELKRQDHLAVRLAMASELYLLNNELDKAMSAIDEAYRIDSTARRAENAAMWLTQKAAVLEAQSRLDEALAVMGKALPVLRQTESLYSLAECYNQMASVNEKLGHRQDAIRYYKMALEQSIKCGSAKTERVAEKGLWQTMREDNPTIAMLHLERYTALTDSLHSRLLSTQAEVTKITDFNKNQEEVDAGVRKMNQVLKWGGLLLVFMLLLMLGVMTFAWRKSKALIAMQRKTHELKSFFFTNITKELQDPLTVIMGAGRLLLENGKSTVEERKRLGSMIVNHGNNMLRMVNRLVEIEEVKSMIDIPELKEGDIVMFVRMLVDNYIQDAQQKLINLEFTSSLSSWTVKFSLEYIRHIVHTLVALAIKFTPGGGHVLVELDRQEAEMLKLVVSDTGKGIPADEKERLFAPFSQSDRNDDDGARVSAGLTLVEQIVQAMNGQMAIDSQEGKGTTFTITVPVQLADNAANAVQDDTVSQFAEQLIRKDSKQMPLVLIVENNEDVAFFIASHLRDRYHLRLNRDGREALKSAQDLVPDLIITSLSLPVMDGWELMKTVRATPTLSHIPIIAITSTLKDQDRVACYQAGANNVLVKPFNSDEMKLLVSNLLVQRSTLSDRVMQNRNDSSGGLQSQNISKEDREFIGKMIDVIHAQMANDGIDMEHIAAALSVSRKQLRARVLEITGMNPVAYVMQVRLNYARRMIVTSDISLTAIATKCGFLSLSHFSKAFKQQFGVSPQQFRKNQADFAVVSYPYSEANNDQLNQ